MLEFYLVSTAISLLVFCVIIKSFAIKFKREYPDFKTNKKSITETISSCLPMFVPVVNIFLVLYMIFNQNATYQKAVEKIKNKTE